MNTTKDESKEQTVNFWMSDRSYTYIHDPNCPSKLIHTHHLIVRTSNAKLLFASIFILILLPNLLYHFLVEDKSLVFHLWSVLVTAFLFKLMLGKRVLKESVVIIPAFGVQLETHYVNGRIIRRFVPIDKILKPVLLERVTPVTCYWTLSLILCDEEELMLVFKELRPPVKMLIHVWKALCMASGIEDRLDPFAERSQQ